jgi:flagellar hook-associated protein 1 FlgK
MNSMFDGLYIARSGVRASQAALNVTGQNITNASTEGYTRQRVDQSSLTPSDGAGIWASLGVSVGNGASVDSISQLRDAFLDLEYRTQNAKSGDTSTLLSSLENLENIFTATTTSSSSSSSAVIDVLSDEYSNFISQLQSLTSNSSSVAESNVRDTANALTQKLNTAAQALQTARNQQYTNLKDYGVKEANTLLKNIASLDKTIKSAEISGSSVLELKDQRNLLLDQLSKYVGIEVVQTPTTLANGKTVDTMSVYLADEDGNALTYLDADGNKQNYTLIGGTDGSDYAQFAVTPAEAITRADTVQISLSALSSNGSAASYQTADGTYGSVNSMLTTGAFSGYLKLLNEKGEYDTAAGGTTTSFRGIGFYSDYLDSLSKQLAATLNTLNSTTTDANGNYIATADKALLAGTDAGGNESIDADDITALNIHVASSWSDGVLTNSKDTSSGIVNGASYSNILTMISALTSSRVKITTNSGISVYTGTSLSAAFANAGTALGQETSSVQTTDDTNANQLNTIDSNRQSISSVSLDDEAIGIVQYTQSLNASSRFMTAVDECLQTIINNMGLVGRG